MDKKTKKQSNDFQSGKPADFSFKHMKVLEAIGLEGARSSRIGGLPDVGAEKQKYLTRSVWLNNNNLKSTKNVDALVESLLEYPEQLGWIDFSFNYITEIDDSILKFTDLKIIYFHGNCIEDLTQLLKLSKLKRLRSITFHGNPIANLTNYRSFVVAALPQIVNLDFTPVLKTEKLSPAPPEYVKSVKIKEIK